MKRGLALVALAAGSALLAPAAPANANPDPDQLQWWYRDNSESHVDNPGPGCIRLSNTPTWPAVSVYNGTGHDVELYAGYDCAGEPYEHLDPYTAGPGRALSALVY